MHVLILYFIICTITHYMYFSRLLFYGTLLAYINLKNRKIDQNTVYPLFSRNANYAEVEHICNIIFFYFTKAIFTILKMLWRTQTSFLSVIFFCKKKILKLRYDFKNSEKQIIAKIPQICKMHFNKLVISSTVESQLKQEHCKFHKIKNTFFYQHFICISLESQSVINMWLSHNTTYFFIQTSDFCFSY